MWLRQTYVDNIALKRGIGIKVPLFKRDLEKYRTFDTDKEMFKTLS